MFTNMKNSFTYSTASYCVYPLYLGIRSFLALFSPRGYISRPNHHQTLMDLILLVGFITFWSYLFSYDSTERGNHNGNQKIYIVPWLLFRKVPRPREGLFPYGPAIFPWSPTQHLYIVIIPILYTSYLYMYKNENQCVYIDIYICVCIYVYNIYCIYYIYIRHSNSVVQSWSLQKQFLVVDLDDLLDFGTKWHGQHTELHEGLGMDNREHPSGIPMLSTAPTTGFNKFTLTQ